MISRCKILKCKEKMENKSLVDKIKLVYMWVKTNHLNLAEFMEIQTYLKE